MMKSSIKKDRIFLVYSGLILLFYLLFSHLVLKSDDGHFLGIISEKGFDVFQWLKYRYDSISGRTLCELLTVGFLSSNLVFWKLFSSILWLVFFAVICKILAAFGEVNNTVRTFVACVPFLIFPGCLNSSVFWFSGSFTYFIPFICSVLCCSPLIFDLFEIKHFSPFTIVLSTICAPFACSQEQSAALTATFLLIIEALNFKKKRTKFSHFIPMIVGGTEIYFLFSSPGMKNRQLMESTGFMRFNNFNVFDKLLCGLTNYYAFEFLFSFAVIGLFVCLLIIKVKEFSYSKNCLSLVKIYFSFFIIMCFTDIMYLIFKRKLPDKGFEEMFKAGKSSIFEWLLIIVCTVFLILTILVILALLKNNFRVGTAVFLCFMASLCSSVIVGFSSSIYASGQRVFFFSEILILIACSILFSSTKDFKKQNKVKLFAIIVSLTTYLLDCFSFMFMETPIMG